MKITEAEASLLIEQIRNEVRSDGENFGRLTIGEVLERYREAKDGLNPCAICGQSGDTVWTEFGWTHQPCSDQQAYEAAANWKDAINA